MASSTPRDLLESLEKSKQRLIEFSSRLTAESNWNEAQRAIEWARQVDTILIALASENGLVGASSPSPASSPRRRDELPDYYVDGHRLVKVGASRDGGTYEHRVIKRHVDLVLAELSEMANAAPEFATQKLIDKCDIPKHEPGVVLGALRTLGLVTALRRGSWEFNDRHGFAQKAQDIWSQLPTQ